MLVFMLCGSIFCFSLYQIAYLYYHAVSGSSLRLILKILSMMSYISVHCRGFSVILWIISKRSKIRSLLNSVEEFCRHSTLEQKQLRSRIKSFSFKITVLLPLSYIVYDLTDWTYYFVHWDIKWFATNVLGRVPIKLTALQYLIQWLLWADLPYIVSQLTFAFIITLAWIVDDAIKQLGLEIETVTQQLRSHARINFEAFTPPEQYCFAWKKEHVRISVFLECIKDCFGGILFVFFCCDLMAVAGLTGQILNAHDSSTVLSNVRLVGNTLVFASYQTLFVFPLVSVYEQVT